MQGVHRGIVVVIGALCALFGGGRTAAKLMYFCPPVYPVNQLCAATLCGFPFVGTVSTWNIMLFVSRMVLYSTALHIREFTK